MASSPKSHKELMKQDVPIWFDAISRSQSEDLLR